MAAVASTPWRRRARSSLPLAPDGTRAGDHDFWSLWLPPGNSLAEPQTLPSKPPLGNPARPGPPPLRGRQRLLQGGRKKQAIDLEASVLGGGMFGAIVPLQLRCHRGRPQSLVDPRQVRYSRV